MNGSPAKAPAAKAPPAKLPGLNFCFCLFFFFFSDILYLVAKGGVPPAGRGGASPAAKGGPPRAGPPCIKCGEGTGKFFFFFCFFCSDFLYVDGQKFCPSCGQVQPGAHEGVVKKGAAGKFQLDHEGLARRFGELTKQDSEQQTEVFLKSFIVPLGDDWKNVLNLQKDFVKMLRDEGDNQTAHNEVQAMTMLQKHGAERTTIQRREEVRDIDLDNDQRISFIEYLLLHFKVMILTEFYKRHECDPEEDLSKGGVGITGVGSKLLDQLFNGVQGGTLPPELEKAIEDFTAMLRARNEKMKTLSEQGKGASVKALAARNELEQMEKEDPTEMNRLEITLNAARRKHLKKKDGAAELEAKRKAELKAEEEKKRLSRASLKEKAALWNNNN